MTEQWLSDVPVGAVVPFESFPVQSDKQRVIIPVLPPMINPEAIPIEWDVAFDAPRVKVEWVAMTFDRTPRGWQRAS